MKPQLPTHRDLALARRSLLRFESRSQRLDTWHDGGRICWRRWGQGPNLVLIHGGHGSWMHWIRNIEPLAARFCLWLPDMPGFGDSDALPGHPHRVDRQDQLIAALAAGLQQLLTDETWIDLAGFSFGGLAAAQLANAWPRTRRLALIGTAGHGGDRRPHPQLLDWRGCKDSHLWEAHHFNLQSLMLHDVEHIDAQALVLHHCSSHATRYRSREFSRSAAVRQALALYRGDLLLLWGEHDVTAVPQDIGPLLCDGFANRHVRIVPDAGHWLQYEQSEQTNQILLDWFQSDI